MHAYMHYKDELVFYIKCSLLILASFWHCWLSADFFALPSLVSLQLLLYPTADLPNHYIYTHIYVYTLTHSLTDRQTDRHAHTHTYTHAHTHTRTHNTNICTQHTYMYIINTHTHTHTTQHNAHTTIDTHTQHEHMYTTHTCVHN